MQAKTAKKGEIIKRKRGRPRLSNLPDNDQARLRMRRNRERKRKGNLVPVEVWISNSQRDSLLKLGYDLSAAATEAFALLLKKHKSAESKEEANQYKGFKIDVNRWV